MTGRVSLICLFVLATVVYVQTAKEIYVKANEMVALRCPGRYHGGDNLNWTSYTTQKMDLTSMSPAEQRKMDLLVLENYLIILKASANHQGNYSCSPGSGGRLRWMRLTVYTVLPREYEERVLYTQKCNIPDSCTLNCPDVNTPSINITRSSITWHKDGKSLPKDRIFDEVYSLLNVKMKDRGVYTCTRSYLYLDHIYNMSFTVVLDVQPNKEEKLAKIKSPRQNETVEVVLGSLKVINCTADYYSNFDEVFWLVGDKFVGTNNSLVFYNFTRNNDSKEMTASLVFTKVSEEDLSKNYTCKLRSESQLPVYVSIHLAQKARRSYVPLSVSIVVFFVVMVITVVIYVKLKIDIALFLRDTLGCHSSTSDGKSYDAFLMCYTSDTDAGLDAHDRKWLENVLEEQFGYSLCLYNRDVLPGKAVADAVLDCIEESRTVVLIPTSADLEPGFGLLSAIHEALVERQTRLVFITTEAKEVSRSESLPEILQHLGETGHCVTWKGINSKPASSSFWKKLRYYLPATYHAPKLRLLPQTVHDIN